MLRVKIISFLLFVSIHTSAQQLQVENYTPANGLLDTRVIKIFQDNRGLIYFLTWEGISIFDGKRFTNISAYNGESLGLVNDMIQWKGDTCYVFTFQKGVYKLVRNRLIKDTLLNDIYEPNHVIQKDSKNWIIVSNGGLYNWDGNQHQPILVKPGNKPEKQVDYAFVQNGYLIYIAQQANELRVLNLASEKITDSMPGKKVYNVVSDRQSKIFINEDGRWLQLNNEALQKGQIKKEPLYFAKQIPVGFTFQHLHFSGRKIWLQSYSKGWVLLNPETGEKEMYSPAGNIDIRSSIVFSDKENNFWFSAINKQVQKGYYTRFKRAYPSVLPQTTSLLADENNQVVANTGKHFFLLQHDIALPAGAADTRAKAAFYWQNLTWVFESPATIKSERGDIINLHTPDNKDSSFFHSYRFSFDRAGRLIIPGKAFYIIEKDLSVHTTAFPNFTDNVITDKDNDYWAIGRGGIVSSYSFDGDRIRRKHISPQIREISPRVFIHWNKDTFCIGTRFQGIVWVTLKNGIAKEFARLNTSNGLSNNFVGCLLKKNDHLLYAGTGTGLDEIMLSKEDTTVQNLAAGNNLYITFQQLEKNQENIVFARSDDSRLWAVTGKTETLTDFIPDAWLNEIAVNGKITDETIHSFNYNQNNFRFAVAAPCFVNAGNLRFDFLLKNETDSWNQYASENFYNINNLPAGRYQLTVTVSYPGKIYPDKEITYSFKILSPFWKRWWFIGLIILLAALILWVSIRAYYKRKLTAQKNEADKKQAVEKERNRISRDMHDDLGSGLTKIAILSEVAKKQLAEPVKAKEQLEKISVSSRELVDNLQDIIWVLNPRNDSLESLAAYIREYALKYFEPLAVKMQFIYPEDFSKQPLSEEKRRNVFLTVKESLHNIAKHAWCNEVTISIGQSPQQFEISIKDDGKGFDPEQARLFANGLKNMQNRIEQVGGMFSIQSEPGNGTLSIMTIPV